MEYTCHDYFMIRIPALPYSYLEEYYKQENDIYEFIRSNKFLDCFFKKALLISSKSIYYSYMNKPSDRKKYKNLKNSLLKYFIRSTTRATPYGHFASVSIGKFSNETNIIKGYEKIDIKIDNSWINYVIKTLEDDKNIFRKLKLKVNKLCFISGDRFKNPYFTNYGVLDKRIFLEHSAIQENNIRYTYLIEKIREYTKNFISYSDLEALIIEKYPGVSKELVYKTIYNLCKNEYLLTNLRIPPYCNDTLEHVIRILNTTNCNSKYIYQLKSIQTLIDKYKLDKNIDRIKDIYDLMSQIHKNKDYLIVNIGNEMKSKNLSFEIKTKIGKLANFLAKIPVELDYLKSFKMRFMEEFGINVEVPLFKIIDTNDFNGLSFIYENTESITKREEKIREVFDEKIFQTILNGKDEVDFVINDFKGLERDGLDCYKTYDLNVMIMEQDKDYRIYLGPVKSSSKAGAMFQRFADCFDKNDFEKYNEIYSKQEQSNQGYLYVETREMSICGQYSNVINNKKNYKYYLCFGNCSNDSEEIDFEDIYIGMSNKGELYIKSKIYNKKIKIIQDNMLNINLNNGIIQLLNYISESTEYFPQNRLYFLGNKNYKYCPRINIEGVTISPRKWCLNDNDLKSNNYEEFLCKLNKSKIIYKIDNIVYQCINDNRIIVDLNKDEDIKLLYSDYRKNKTLFLNEIEKELFTGALIKDDNENLYTNEFVFSIVPADITKNTGIEHVSNKLTLQETKTNFCFCENGWIYLKLYNEESRLNELLSKYLPELLKRLNNPNHFFIRYNDSIGNHLRIRIKFKDEAEAIDNIIIINEWIRDMRDKKIISRVLFDTYKREVNRYGGYEIINYCERVFFEDSVFVEKIINKIDLTDKGELEEVYIFGIVNIMKYLTYNIEEMLLCLETIGFKDVYRKEYRSKAKEYIKFIDDIIEERSEKYSELLSDFKQEKYTLIKFRDEMNKQINKNKNTSEKESIILSIVHMYCNRVNGYRAYEEKYLEIIRNAIYHIINRNYAIDKKSKSK